MMRSQLIRSQTIAGVRRIRSYPVGRAVKFPIASTWHPSSELRNTRDILSFGVPRSCFSSAVHIELPEKFVFC